MGKADSSQVRIASENIFKGINICKDLKFRPDHSIGHLFLGELYADSGQEKKALEKLKIAEGMFKEMEMEYWLTKTQEVLARL